MRVCFTGPAYDGNGEPVLRADLIEAAQRAGHVVLPSVQHGMDLLVASRSDTVKAQKAMQRGVPVMDYPTFLQALPKPPTAAKRRYQPDPWADTHLTRKPQVNLVGNEL